MKNSESFIQIEEIKKEKLVEFSKIQSKKEHILFLRRAKKSFPMSNFS